ncbi:MAG: cobalamin-binding protein [Pyrinomonadaceae bacterium]
MKRLKSLIVAVPVAVVWIALAFTAFGLLVTCRSNPEVDRTEISAFRVVQDDLGRNVQLPVRIERAISLAPSLTESIFAVGAGDKLVGVTTYCNFPSEAQSIQKVSDTQTPNIETIVALRPQVVFVSTASQLEAFMQTLEERNIAVFVTNSNSLEDVFQSVEQFGELFGTADQAEELVNTLNERLAAIKTKIAAEPSKSVFLQISKEPLFTAGKDSFLTELVAIAGGRSVTAEVPSGYPKLSKETALALNPEALILSDSPDNQEPNDVFKNSPAIRNGRVYRINADIISRPGPRSIDALEEIARVLHQ